MLRRLAGTFIITTAPLSSTYSFQPNLLRSFVNNIRGPTINECCSNKFINSKRFSSTNDDEIPGSNDDKRVSVPSTTDSSISKQKKVVKKRTKKDRWITCSSTKELAAAVKYYVKPNSCVAELGSQLREVSTAICDSLCSSGNVEICELGVTGGPGGQKRKGHATLVDVQRKFPSGDQSHSRTNAMRRPGDDNNFYPDRSTFTEIESLDNWRNAFIETNLKYDVFVLDINSIVGNDLEWTSLSIVREFIALFNDSCKVVLIKSMLLNQWSTRLIHGQRWIRSRGETKDFLPLPHVIATVGVQEYRDTIPFTVQAGDAVLEVGCHLGTSTDLLYKAAALNKAEAMNDNLSSLCIGVDVGSKIIQGARERYPHIHFAVGDAWKMAQLLRIQHEFLTQLKDSRVIVPEGCRSIGFDVVYVDVGGLSGSDGLLESLFLLSSLMYAIEPRSIVIKSLCIRRLSSTLTPAWQILGSTGSK